MAIKFWNIQQVLEHKFIGNHASDMEAFMAIDDFIRTTRKQRDRIAAFRHMSEQGMGIICTDQELADGVLETIQQK